jgi:hypothetical protein
MGKFAFAAGIAALLTAAPALAQQAPAPSKKKQAAKNATEIVVVNNRGAVVTGLQVTSAAGKNVAALKKPLEPGKKISLKLPKGAGCTFAVNAAFSDDAEFDQTEVNLCTDKTVRFVD